MDSRENKTVTEIVGLVKSWIPWRSEPANVSRDFWMPDQSCRVCYECDAQFTIFNRRHHCRHCGRIFCGKCTANSVPASSDNFRYHQEDTDRIRVCNYCFKQWEAGITSLDRGPQFSSLDLSTTSSSVSSKSTITANSSSSALISMPGLIGPYQRVQVSSGVNIHQPSSIETNTCRQDELTSRRSRTLTASEIEDPCQFSLTRSDDEDDACSVFRTDLEIRKSLEANNFYTPTESYQMSNGSGNGSHKLLPTGEYSPRKSFHRSPGLQDHCDLSSFEETLETGKKDVQSIGYECEAPSSPSAAEDDVAAIVDFEKDGLLWFPPEPEDEEYEEETTEYDQDEEEDEGAGEWGCLRSSNSFGGGESLNTERSNEEHKKEMKNVVDGHFRALVAQLLQVENLPVDDTDGNESWLEIITSLSWEAANLLKPDMSKSGGMDPGGYVKVKCIASGRRSDSMVVKGVVCKKNVAHRRMTSKLVKPRLVILGGALEYQRVSNQLSCFDTLLQQEMDHLKMAVAKIEVHRPNILLVEKSVSRFAQEYLLAKDITLVLNIKKPLLERIARCTGAPIFASIDHLSSRNVGNCGTFRVHRFLEDLGSAGQAGKKLVKTLMFFEECPKPLGFTILLRGANGDDLKKVKHVVQYGVFAAYHLALETSFLADEGASPDLPLNFPINVALPDKSSCIERSISAVPGFSASPIEKPPQFNSVSAADLLKTESGQLPFVLDRTNSQTTQTTSNSNHASGVAFPLTNKVMSDPIPEENVEVSLEASLMVDTPVAKNRLAPLNDVKNNDFGVLETLGQGVEANSSHDDYSAVVGSQVSGLEVSSMHVDDNEKQKEVGSLKEDFPPSPSDHQSILVSLSSRCVWKGTVCERSHLFRIKYYGSFDKPLGRFLRDNLFDQSYQCRSCEMPAIAHVHCYTHRQGTLTISVKKITGINLAGVKEGKIWMWHRCLRCPRINNFPPATKRVVMSDAAWGLSFGKFLELSFSNHAAASRVACCGHSLHRDCLRFYGFGEMVACFRYATIDVHSVYLPPAKLNFNYENQDWTEKELNEVVERADLLFSDVLNTLSQIAKNALKITSGRKVSESRHHIDELEEMMQAEKGEFEENIKKVLNPDMKKGRPVPDVLEIYRLRRQLIFQSYMWDHRLIYATNLDNKSFDNDPSSEVSEPVLETKKLPEMTVAENNVETINSDETSPNQLEPKYAELSHRNEDQIRLLSSKSVCEQFNSHGSGIDVRRTLSDGQIPAVTNLSASLDAAWTGENSVGTEMRTDTFYELPDSSEGMDIDGSKQHETVPKRNISLGLPVKTPENLEESASWLGTSVLNFYRSINKSFLSSSGKLDTLSEYNPVYISSFRESELQDGARLLLPIGVNDTVVPVYDDEPTSIISYALASPEYHLQLSDECERLLRDGGDSALSLPCPNVSFLTTDETAGDQLKSLGSLDLSLSRSHSSLLVDPFPYPKALHAKVSLEDDGQLGKVKYSVTVYFAKRFEILRGICLPSELDYIRSLSRCKKWGAQGGKSNVFFAKTLDDRFIVKQVTKTELESFMKFAPAYFKYISESIITKSPTCLAKVLGIYQVTSKHLRSGRETKMDVLVMENLFFGRNVKRVYDLKGSTRARYNPDSSGSNKVLLDQNLIEAMPTSPIFVGNKAKRLLERAVWNDTAFLASVDVMDYSLLVGVDEDKHELVLGIIDFLRQYTWDKHLETWVKASGILGGPKNASPTVISPKQYKKRFRKAMTTYFLMVPDQWSPSSTCPTKSQSDFGDENSQSGRSVE